MVCVSEHFKVCYKKEIRKCVWLACQNKKIPGSSVKALSRIRRECEYLTVYNYFIAIEY
jgi:hypothetical protein